MLDLDKIKDDIIVMLGNKTPSMLRVESFANSVSELVKELETLRAERKAMMEQEHVTEVSRIYDPKILADVVSVFMPVGAKLYAQPIPVQPSPAVSVPTVDKLKLKSYIDQNIHDGLDRSGARDTLIFRPDELQEFIEECFEATLSTPTPPSAEQDEKSDSGKAKNWDYYQELLKLNGFSGITDLLTKFHEIERSAEKPNSADTNVLEDVQQLAFEYGHNEDGSGYILGNEEFDKCIELAIKLAAEKQQRITEQDAAEIAHSALKFWRNTVNLTLQSWLNGECDPLLAKLNEHREPDCKAQRDLLLAAAKEIFRPAQSVSNIAFNLGQHHKEWDNSIYPSIKELDAARSKLSAAIAQCEGKGNV